MRTLACLALVLLTATSTRAAETNSAIAPVDYELRVKDRPIIQRGFLPESSPRSIAVGLPSGVRVSAAGRELTGDAAGWVKIPRGSPTRFEVLIPEPNKAAASTNKEER